MCDVAITVSPSYAQEVWMCDVATTVSPHLHKRCA
jgi:hypothetical protein